MPNRSLNTPRKGTKNQVAQRRGTSARGGGASGAGASWANGSQGRLVHDMVGVVAAVIAVALIIALVVPTNAPVTYVTAQILSQGFGVGALLVPIAMLLYVISYFLVNEKPMSVRIGLGLGLIVLAILSILSVSLPAAALDVAHVIEPSYVTQAGGYVGGSIAWVALRYLGKSVSLVLLVGLIIVGIVVCGFSVSGSVSKLKESVQDWYDGVSARRASRAERAQFASDAQMAAAAAAQQGYPASAARLRGTAGSGRGAGVAGAAIAAPATTFIGSRKTSVIKRGLAGTGAASAAGSLSTTATTLLSRKKHPSARPDGQGATAPDSAKTTLLGFGAVDEASSAKTPAKPSTKQSTKQSSKPAVDPLRQRSDNDDAALPPLNMIKHSAADAKAAVSSDELSATAAKLQATLEEFGLVSRVVGWTSGPAVTTFKIEMGEGERVNKIRNLEDDIALSLAAKSVRIFAPIPGTSLVGIEIPNKATQAVFLGDVLPHVTGGPLEAAFGRDSEGAPVVVDIAALPHLLVAGTTGSGKSVLLNSIVMTMLMRATPEELRLIMVDPKRVEFTFYASLPHLYVPVVTEPRQATSALQWGVTEMERRLKVFEHYKVRDIKSFNGQVESGKLAQMDNPPAKMPYFVIVIDELSDLMMVAGKDVEASIVRIAQLGRAAGIHLIVATQRPSADVVTGLIKANIDNRVALSVDNSINSRIILDQTGAEKLLGRGDMLYKLRGRKPKRAQACFVSEAEVERVVDFIKQHHEADYHEDILSVVAPATAAGSGGGAGADDDDPLLWEAAQIVVDSQLGSTSGIQRRLKVGYARAGRIMDMLQAKGIVGPPDGSKPREVLVTADELDELRADQ